MTLPPFQLVLAAAAGGALGAALRFCVGFWAQAGARPGSWVPYLGTLTVNLVGCLVIGYLLASQRLQGDAVRIFSVVGILGGFTTYSAFGWETLQLLESSGVGRAATYVGLHLALGLGAVALGARLA